jgi:hypothetical protein
MFEVQYAKSITIPEGEVSKITDSSGNLIWQKCDYLYLPRNIEESNAVAVDAISLSQGDVVTVYYRLTSTSGILCDASNCGGSSYSCSSLSANTHGAFTFTASKAGKFIIAGQYSRYQWGIDWPGSLGMSPPYVEYIKIKIN